MLTKTKISTMMHKAVDNIINGWDVPKDEGIHFFQHEDADTFEKQLGDLVDSCLYLAPK